MKHKILNSIIIVLALFTAYFFYSVWQSDVVTLQKIEPEKKSAPQSLEDKTLTPKENTLLKLATEPQKPLKKSEEKVTFKTVQQVEAENQEIYERLKPEEHDRLIETANEHYSTLQERVIEVDKSVIEEEQAMHQIETFKAEQIENVNSEEPQLDTENALEYSEVTEE